MSKQDPFGLHFVTTNPDVVVVVDRRADNPDPDYLCSGRTRCNRCDEWCWLGSETFGAVMSGKATPLCLVCAMEVREELAKSIPLSVLQNRTKGDRQ